MTKQKKRAALKAVLSMKNKDQKLVILDKWVEKSKTKEMANIFKNMKIDNALIVIDEKTEWLERTVNNIPRINVAYSSLLNPYYIMAHDWMICTKDVATKIQEGLQK